MIRRLPSWPLLAIIPVILANGLLGVTSEKGYSLAVMSDSISYIESARWFAAGQGVSLGEPESLKPMTHFPPLYPIALGAGTMLGQTAERTAAITHPICLALTLFFLGCLVFRLGGSVAVGVAAQWFGALSWDLLRLPLYVFSEPLFLTLAFGAICLLVEHSRRASLPYLVCAAVLLGLASMTRFAGLGIACGAAAYFAWHSRHRVRDAVIVLLGGIGPFMVWTISQRSDGMHGIDRKIGITLPAMTNIDTGLRTLGEYIVPRVWPDIRVYLLTLILLGILAVGVRWPRTRILAAIGLGYLGFVLFSLVFVDPGIPLDPRILIPIFPITIVITAVPIAIALRCVQDFRNLAFVACILLVLSVDYTDYRRSQIATALPHDVRQGVGYERSLLRRSAILSRLAEQPVDALILFGNPVALHYLTGRTSIRVPVNAGGPDDPQVMRLADRLKGHSAIFLDHRKLLKNPSSADAREMGNWFQLTLIAEERDGRIYRVSVLEPAGQVTGELPSPSTRTH